MYSLIFGLFSLALLLFFGMFHTFIFVKKMKRELEYKRKYIQYGVTLGISGCISLSLAIVLYFIGVG